MKNRISFIPSLFTILNLFCGFLSIINAANNELNGACLFILYAGLFDMFDGFVARLTKTSSRFGVELDSLSDIVSFGTAPAFLLYKFHFFELNGPGMALSSLVMIFAALRLARFNVQLSGFDKHYFTGIPAPMSAVTLSSFFMFYYNRNFDENTSVLFVYILSLVLPVLLVSKFKYDTVPKISLRLIKVHPVKFTLIFLIATLVIFTKGEGLFAFCIFYLSTGIFRSVLGFLRKLFSGKKTYEEEDLKLKIEN